jgi:hypothetical protein
LGICAYRALTWAAGPPISVVPVSIAAYEDEPEGSVIDPEFTVRLVIGRVQYEIASEGTD